MVAPDEYHFVGIQTLPDHEHADGLNTIIPPVHIIPQEHIAPVPHPGHNIGDHIHQIIELAMDVPDYALLAIELQDVGLLDQDLDAALAQPVELGLGQQGGFLQFRGIGL